MSDNIRNSDEQLVAKAIKGDRDAFEAIYDTYAPRIKAYFFQMLWKDHELAEDLTQELFIKVVENLSKYDPSRSFKTWVFSMANNMCKNAYRHQEVKSRASMHLSYMNPNFTENAENQYDRSVFRKELEKNLNAMDPKKKEVFILRYKYDLSVQETAEVMGVKPGTVKSRAFNVLKELANQLNAFNPKKNHG
jgi:RNA polymerase sigma-70 factor (ECF subfamily)